MDNVFFRIIASVFTSCFFCACTWKLLGAIQQSGYNSRVFWRWARRKDNLFYNRLCVYALCVALSTTVTALCFSFLGTRVALLMSALPFVACSICFCYADRKFALKVPIQKTGRLWRLFATYALFVACVSYFWIAFLAFLAKWNGSELYALVSFAPFALLVLLLPILLYAANAVEGVFEKLRNEKFVKGAGQVLDECEIIRIGIVGSYGKTSVKNILKGILLEKYSVVETPASYNTPIGLAKTVFSPAFSDKQVLIAEMGARHKGDIKQLCDLVKPDYAIFTGICAQHMQTFGSLENVWEAKKEIFGSGAKVVCGNNLRARVQADETIEKKKVLFAEAVSVKDVCLQATETSFTLCAGQEEFLIKTKLLGGAAVENILLAATLAYEMGVSGAEIAKGIEKLDYIPHRLQLMERDGVYILDDAYNCNPKGAEESLAALARFSSRKCVITPGIIECGVLEEEINGKLGEQLADGGFDKIILVGDTLVGAVKSGYETAGGNAANIEVVKTLDEAVGLFLAWMKKGDALLFLNDLPDVY